MRRAAGLVAVALAAAGCSTTVAGTAVPVGPGSGGGDEALVTRYFADLNAAADEGSSAQREYLRRTQHPDFTDRACDLGDLTLAIEPALSTFRPDARWRPERSAKPPRGTVYVLGVTVRIRRDGATLAEQIGNQRVVVLSGKAYGFTPCPTE
ncbi:hypothetical protein [Actinokineospora bangkokensis]|uniref:Lipoprotein n=1 Tax=Actinokineospora bangkokensis TaxID=1193682 RepID=A0A1Q9LFM0_9PSEU|nr:hypothetical protein [Actinokineospora bangkokensis]OLR90831.1 hypothetical protein BJP25_30150 [Actinokineospora bangkokensis]